MSLKKHRAFAALITSICTVGVFTGSALAAPPSEQTQVCSGDGIVCASWPSTIAPGSEFVLQSSFTNTASSAFKYWLADSLGHVLDNVSHVAAGHSHSIKTTMQAPASGCMSINYYGDFAPPVPPGEGVFLLSIQVCVT